MSLVGIMDQLTHTGTVSEKLHTSLRGAHQQLGSLTKPGLCIRGNILERTQQDALTDAPAGGVSLSERAPVPKEGASAASRAHQPAGFCWLFSPLAITKRKVPSQVSMRSCCLVTADRRCLCSAVFWYYYRLEKHYFPSLWYKEIMWDCNGEENYYL